MNLELQAGLENTYAFYGRDNALSISHERSSSGYADLADAACTAIKDSRSASEHRFKIIDRRLLGF